MSLWPYLLGAAVASVVLTLIVIGAHEVWRNLEYQCRERRIERASKAAQAKGED